jgi:TPR repeat protein
MGRPQKNRKNETVEDSNDTQAAEEAPRGKRLPILIAAVIIATGIAVWLVPEQEDSPPKSAPKTTVALPAPETGPHQQAETPPIAEAKAPSRIQTETRPGEYARTLIARLRNNDPGNAGPEAFAAALQQSEAGRKEDAYLLYFFAAKQGHAEAALTLGTQTDPAYFDPESGIHDEADPAQAHKWYRMAVDNGNAEAERRLASLFERVEKQAAAGDEQARRLLLQWR